MWETSEPVENTLETTLQLFPFAEPRTKRQREETISPNALESILFPSTVEILEDSMERLIVEPKRYKQDVPVLKPRFINSRALVTTTPGKPGRRVRKQIQLSPATLAPKKVYYYMPPNEFKVQMVVPFTLFPYQIDAVKWMVEREEGRVRNPHYESGINGCMLAMYMGLGKTPIAATLLARSLTQQRAEQSCSIYVCPKTLIGTVRYELEKFFGDQIRVIIYNEEFLRKEYNSFGLNEIRKYDVIIANYDSLVSRMKSQPTLAVQEFCNFQWFRIILDESHEIRERTTARFAALMKFKSSRRICMTATAIHNGVRDLYNQMEFTGFRLPAKMKPTEKNLLPLGLFDMIRFVRTKDAKSVVLPKKHVEKVYFELSETERKLHTYYLEHARTVERKGMQQLVWLTRILQVCSAPYLITAASKTEDDDDYEDGFMFPMYDGLDAWIRDRNGPAGIGSSKMRAFVNLMASVTTKTVVFANKTSTLRLAQSALNAGVVVCGKMPIPKREEMFTQFRTSTHTNVLFITLKLGSIGLNLTEASTVVFLEPWYNHALLSQGESRVHRLGQTREVHIYYLLGKDSSEERVYKVAQNKQALSDDIEKSASTQKPAPQDIRYMLMEEMEVEPY
jgi:SNF2 family DNA or RNA helicase